MYNTELENDACDAYNDTAFAFVVLESDAPPSVTVSPPSVIVVPPLPATLKEVVPDEVPVFASIKLNAVFAVLVVSKYNNELVSDACVPFTVIATAFAELVTVPPPSVTVIPPAAIVVAPLPATLNTSTLFA